MNSNNFSEKNPDLITLDERGRVVIQDDTLAISAKIDEELTLNELEKVSGSITLNANKCGTGVVVNLTLCC